MPNFKRIHYDDLTGPGYTDAFRRAFDLVLAQNLLRSLRTGETFYDDQAGARVSEFCRGLDVGLREEFLGVHRVVPNPGAPYRELDDALAFLVGRQRGAWAILRDAEGGHEAFMADGIGGAASRTGRLFTQRTPDHPALGFSELYGHALGMAIYERRKVIQAEIVAASFDAAGDPVGRTARDAHIGGHRWNRVETYAVDPDRPMEGRPAVMARCTRRGVRAAHYAIGPSSFVTTFGAPYVMPAAYAEGAGRDMTRTLHERRDAAARTRAKADLAGLEGLAADRHIHFRVAPDAPDAWLGSVYRDGDAPGQASVGFEVAFAPGDDAIVGAAHGLMRDAPYLDRMAAGPRR